MIRHIPKELWHKILSYVEYRERLRFTMMNAFVSELLVKAVRQICLKSSQSIRRFFEDKEFQERISNLLDNPAQQLKLEYLTFIPLASLILPDYKFSVDQFPSPLNHRNAELYNLIQQINQLLVNDPSDPRDTYESWSETFQKIKELNIIVNEIYLRSSSLDNYSIPPIQTQALTLSYLSKPINEVLNLNFYQNLKSLALHCCDLSDVSTLGRIHRLILEDCNLIEDISSLQYNYHISIVNCLKIKDYSKSFQFSTIINITVETSEEIFISELNLPNAKELSFLGSSERHIQFLPSELRINAPLLLRLKVHHFPTLIFIMNHKVQELSLENAFTNISLHHFPDLILLNLVKVPLMSLNGIEKKLSKARIINCNLIEDFSPLKACCSVEIVDCSSLVNTLSFTNAKELKIAPVTFDNLIDYNRATSITTPLGDHLKCLPLMTSLQELILNITLESFFHSKDDYFDWILQSSHIKRLVYQVPQKEMSIFLQRACRRYQILESRFKVDRSEIKNCKLILYTI